MATQRRQIDVAKVSIHDLLPADVQDRVVWRSDYWLPGEACSTYAFSETLVSMDNHSPIFAHARDLPPPHYRHHQRRDVARPRPRRLARGNRRHRLRRYSSNASCRSIQTDRPVALARVAAFMARVHEHQRNALDVLRESLVATTAGLQP
ncbi:MAG: hypothetical protein ABII82_20725 [Verrucomicrobiota bacterium]